MLENTVIHHHHKHCTKCQVMDFKIFYYHLAQKTHSSKNPTLLNVLLLVNHIHFNFPLKTNMVYVEYLIKHHCLNHLVGLFKEGLMS